MKFLIPTFILYFSLLVYSCNNDNTNKKEIKKFSLGIIDTLFVNSPGFTFGDNVGKRFLFYNKLSGEILVTDFNTLNYRFVHFGKGEGEYPILHDNVSFYNKDTICVGINGGILLFTSEGKYIKTVYYSGNRPPNFGLLFNIISSKEKKYIIAGIQLRNFASNMKSEYSKTNFTSIYFDLMKGKSRLFCPFPPPGTNWNEKKYFYPHASFAHLTIDKKGKFLYSVFENGDYIYKYNLQSLNLEKIIAIQAKNYIPYRQRYGDNTDWYSSIKILLQNSIMKKIFVTSKYIILYFRAGIEEFEAKKLAKRLTKNPTTELPYLPSYVSILDKNHNYAIVDEFALGTFIGTPKKLINDTSLLFKGKNTEKDDILGRERFYVVKLKSIGK